MTVVVFAFGESFFGVSCGGDIDDGDGDADDLVDFVARGLIGDEEGARCAGPVRVGKADFKACVWFAVEGAQEIRLALRRISPG